MAQQNEKSTREFAVLDFGLTGHFLDGHHQFVQFFCRRIDIGSHARAGDFLPFDSGGMYFPIAVQSGGNIAGLFALESKIADGAAPIGMR